MNTYEIMLSAFFHSVSLVALPPASICFIKTFDQLRFKIISCQGQINSAQAFIIRFVAGSIKKC